jgi:hypothetical protein
LDASIGSPFKRARAETEDGGAALDVSGAKKASELFSSSIFQTTEGSKGLSDTKNGDVVKAKGDAMQDEEEL